MFCQKLCNKAKKINYMFLRHRPHHLQPPAPKIFIAFPVFILKNHLYVTNCLSFSTILFVFIWLVDHQLVAAHIKSQKLPKITQIHHFYSILLKKLKIKCCLQHHFLTKVPEKHITCTCITFFDLKLFKKSFIVNKSVFLRKHSPLSCR